MTEMDPRLVTPEDSGDISTESEFLPGELDGSGDFSAPEEPAPVEPAPVVETPVVPVENPPVVDVPVESAPIVNIPPVATPEVPAAAETSTPTATVDLSGHWLPSKVYDILKFLAQLFLPAVATLYFALAPTWNWPRPEDVVGTITAVDAFLGVFLSYTKGQYMASDAPYDGDLIKSTSATGQTQLLVALNDDPSNLSKTATFKVKS